MTDQTITCPLCSQRFDPQGRSACPSCALNKGCQLVCCPYCGYETVDVNQSLLARSVSNLFSHRGKKESVSKQNNFNIVEKHDNV